jgi:flagellar capping protein FliD
MEILQVVGIVFGVMLGVISFFLKATMDDIKKMKECVYSTKTKVEVMEKDYLNKHQNLTEKFDLLNTTMRDLTSEIKKLSEQIHRGM